MICSPKYTFELLFSFVTECTLSSESHLTIMFGMLCFWNGVTSIHTAFIR